MFCPLPLSSCFRFLIVFDFVFVLLDICLFLLSVVFRRKAPLSTIDSTSMPFRLALLNRPSHLEAWTLQKQVDLESYFYAQIRRESFHLRLFAVSLLLASALAACTSVLLSQTATLAKASEYCQERFAMVQFKLDNFDIELTKNASHVELLPGLMRLVGSKSLPLFESEPTPNPSPQPPPLTS
jgi:hypothetical protein